MQLSLYILADMWNTMRQEMYHRVLTSLNKILYCNLLNLHIFRSDPIQSDLNNYRTTNYDIKHNCRGK